MIKKCIVIGGAGLIGIYLVNQLIEKNYHVTVYDLAQQINQNKKFLNKKAILIKGSILNKKLLGKAISGNKYVFHLAAMLGVKKTEDNKLDCLKINCVGTQNVLEQCVKNKVKKVIFASSSEVYGEPDKNPIDEKATTKGKTIYGLSKLIGEEYCKSYYQKYKLNYTILRYFNTYGVYQKKEFVISKFVEKIRNNQPIIINGNGKQKRSYLYASDTALATMKACFTKKTDQQIYNLGNSYEPITLLGLANKIGKVLNKKLKIKMNKNFVDNSDRSKEREIYYRYCNSSKLDRVIGWRPLINLNQGIKIITNFYQK
jgi:nucleoside-diphosphate-sugar epimerase